MRVSLAEVGRRGRMDLAFSRQDGQTVLRHAYCEVPFKVTRVLNSHEPVAHVILMHCTAGLFGGDEVECSIRVEHGARILLTQQSATKIHPSVERPAIQRNHVFVEAGAELQLYLEPIIPFTDSIFRQTTRIDVEPGARLLFWEGFMAGRVGRGERWRFREFASETRVCANNQLVYLDRFRLVPGGFECSPWAMGECSYMGTGLYIGDQARCLAKELHQAMPEAGIDSLADNISVVRVATATGPDFHRSRETFSHHANCGNNNFVV